MLRDMEERFLRLHCKYLLEGFAGKRKVSIEGISREVFLFKHDYMMGFGSFWGRILLNKDLFERDECSIRHIFLHEVGHTKRPVLNLLTGISQWILGPLGLIIGALISITVMTILDTGLIEIPVTYGEMVYLPAIYSASVLVSYTGELQAQFFALDRIGIEEFKKATKIQEKRMPEISRLEKLSMNLRYPSSDQVLKIYGKLE